MPTYEYRCKLCEKVFEFDSNNVNAYCCSEPLKRIYNPAGVQFKGTGFYKNDYSDKK